MGFVVLLFPGGVLLILHFKCTWNGTFSNLQRAYGRGITEQGSCFRLDKRQLQTPCLRGGRKMRRPTAPLEKGPGWKEEGLAALPPPLGPRRTGVRGMSLPRTHKSFPSLVIATTQTCPTPSSPGNQPEPHFCPNLFMSPCLSLKTLFVPSSSDVKVWFLLICCIFPCNFPSQPPNATLTLLPRTNMMLHLYSAHLCTFPITTHVLL